MHWGPKKQSAIFNPTIRQAESTIACMLSTLEVHETVDSLVGREGSEDWDPDSHLANRNTPLAPNTESMAPSNLILSKKKTFIIYLSICLLSPLWGLLRTSPCWSSTVGSFKNKLITSSRLSAFPAGFVDFKHSQTFRLVYYPGMNTHQKLFIESTALCTRFNVFPFLFFFLSFFLKKGFAIRW